MQATRSIFVTVLKISAKILLRVEVEGLERIPASGAVILATNHINSIDGLLLYTLLPRHIIAWAKIEIWGNPILRILAESLEPIPLRRGELDIHSVRLALQALGDGKMLGIAPEGTRSWHGRLQQGHPGLVFLVLRAPDTFILPAVVYGQERFGKNLRRLRRTQVNVIIGQGFHLNPGGGRVTREMRQEITDEIMMQLAALLPPEYRGVYSDVAAATERYLRFPPGATSNLHRALGKVPPSAGRGATPSASEKEGA
jgi:1-acyl-sn-glycerol-3-phosphate acyltransferase